MCNEPFPWPDSTRATSGPVRSGNMTAVLEQETIDMAAATTLVMQMLKDGQATMMGVLSSVGDRLGLFESLATYGPIGSDAFAERSGIDARYAREWLSAMACQGYITYDE